MWSKLFKLASALSLVLCLAFAALLMRSWFVEEHLAHAINSGPAWVVRSFHGRITFEHRSFWDAQGGFTWGRRRVGFHENPALALYQSPTRDYGLFDVGFFSGTAYTWPGHLYPTVATLPPTTDPRYWRDNYSAIVLPDLLPSSSSPFSH